MAWGILPPMRQPLHRRIARWFVDTDLRDDADALARASALCLFLWGLKVYLALWYVFVKDIGPLHETPVWTWPLLGGGDVALCGFLAGLYLLALQFGRALPGRAASAFRFVVPLALHGFVVVFSVASLIVNQLYGWPLDNGHMRQADDLGVMGDSIRAYVNVASVTMLAAGFGSFFVVAAPLRRVVVARLSGARSRLTLWTVAALFSLGLGAGWLFTFDGLYLYGVKKNAVIHYVQYYEPPLEPLRAGEVLAELRETVGPHESAMNDFASPRRGPGATVQTGLDLTGKAAGMNVLFVLMESTSREYVDERTTPNLLRLTEHGLSFPNHLTVYSETHKAVYGLFYSDYLVDLGGPPRALYNRPLPQPALPEALRGAGYDTALFHSGYLAFTDLRFWFENKGFDLLAGAMELRKDERDIGWMWGLYEERTVASLTEWIEKRKHDAAGRPFFAVYSPMFPHHPYHCPLPEEQKPYPDDSWLNRYRNALHYTDRNVGTLIDNLRKLDALDDTLIVVVGDHGETVSTTPFGHGMAMTYEEIRTPMIVSNPRLFPAARSADARLVSTHLDVAPTLLGLLGVDAPAQWLGRDLSSPAAPARTSFVTVDQARLTGVVDDGVLFVLDGKGGADPVQWYEITPEALRPLRPSADDPLLSHADTYRARADRFDAWATFRHVRRAVEGEAGEPRPGGAVERVATR